MAEKGTKEGTTATVAAYPMCDICKQNGDDTVPAQYDAKTNMGPWASLCITHFTLYTPGKLGVGIAQKYVLEENTYREEVKRDAYFCPDHGMSHPLVAHWACFDEHLARVIAAEA